MLMLRELQSELGRFLMGERPRQLLQLVDGAGLDAAARLSIYRNNMLATLTAALKATFPVVCRLVDERFFDYAAYEFIQHNLPAEPCLSEYGGDFPTFLAGFRPASGVVYLADVARLEWSINRVLRAQRPETPVSRAALAEVTGDPARCRLRLAAVSAYIASSYPIDRIWRQHQAGMDPVAITFGGTAVHLQVQFANGLEITQLLPSVWTFRSCIGNKATLGSAAEAAFAVAPDFDLALALAELFDAGLVVALEQDEQTHSSEGN